MKDALKSLGILIVGLLVAIVVYPFLHEMGHSIIAVFVGAEVIEVTLLPIPSVLCNVKGVGHNGLVVIGFGGIVFPALVSFAIPRKRFFAWYFRTLLQGMSMFALTISLVSALFEINPQDDVFQILRCWKYGEPLLLLILGLGITAITMLIWFDKPWRRILDYFEI